MAGHSSIDVVRSVIALLEHARLRPGMFFGKIDSLAAENFLGGFDVGTSFVREQLAIPVDMRSFREKVKQDRGYNTRIVSFSQLEEQIRRRFPNDDQVVAELFDIEIAAWRLLLDSLNPNTPA